MLNFIFAARAYADTGLGADQQLVSLLSNMHSLQADFTQVNKDVRGRVIRYANGVMRLQRPGKFRLDVKQPQAQQIIVDGKQVWIYDPSLAQATHHNISKGEVATSPAAMLSDSTLQLANQYQITRLNKSKRTSLWFKLVPKSPSSLLHWVELGFTNERLTAMRIADNLEQMSEFAFHNIQVNPSLDARLFQFLLPAGVEIVNT